MRYRELLLTATLALAGCQTPAPQSVADSQRPPTAADKRETLKIARSGGYKGSNFVNAYISSVVLLDPEKKIYAFCLRTRERNATRDGLIGIAMQNGRYIASTVNDYRCRDKRLRYYDFPELRSL